jgi:hypothetical protein
MLRRSLRRRLLGGNADYRSGIESVLGSGPRRSSAMARNSALYSLRLVREAFRIEATTFRFDLAKARRAVTPYVDRAVLRLRNLPSVQAQLSRVLFIVGRSGLLVGIGEALRDRYAPVEGQLPGRLAMLLKQLEEAPQRAR